MLIRSRVTLALTALLPLSVSCKDIVCAGVGAPGVSVTVVDSLTDAPATAGATLLVYDLDHGGVRVDSVTGQADAQTLDGAINRTGRFSVAVRKTGYRDWTKADVAVRDSCPHITTAILTARLARP